MRVTNVSEVVVPEGSRWTALSFKGRKVLCKCLCGSERLVSLHSLVNGVSRSCGCYKREVAKKLMTTHGLCRTRVHRAWESMKRRCSNPKDKRYADYGGRGITVCDEWQKFSSFYEFVLSILPDGETSIPAGMSIDRMENSRGYEPGNIRIADRKTQGRNTRANRVICVGGVSRCVSEWSEIYGVRHSTISSRLKSGWGEEEAVTLPVRSKS